MSKTPKSSIKTRITLWYAALLLMICVAAICILMAVSEHAADEYCRETLVNATVVIIDELDVDEGRLELDTDIDEVPGVYASLYDLNGTLIYGRLRTELPFEDGMIREVKNEADSWYVLDTLLMIEGRENVWLRVYMSANVNENVLRQVAASGAWLLPLLGLMALLGGYLITVRAFRPVKEMSELAASIADGNDLTRRVGFGGRSADELHMLADTLNEMLSRLEAAFVRESRFASDAALFFLQLIDSVYDFNAVVLVKMGIYFLDRLHSVANSFCNFIKRKIGVRNQPGNMTVPKSMRSDARETRDGGQFIKFSR